MPDKEWRSTFPGGDIAVMGKVTWAGVAMMAVILGGAYYYGRPRADETEQLRIQFRLPTGTPMDQVRINRSGGKGFEAPIEGIVRFSPEVLARYVETMADPVKWSGRPLVLNGQSYDGTYSPGTLAWKDKDDAVSVAWEALSQRRAQESRRAKVLCIKIPLRVTDRPPAPTEPCRSGGTTGNDAIVQGLVDLETGELHMLIRRTRSAVTP